MSDGLDRIGCEAGDITRIAVDAIVNAVNESLRGGGGVDGAIHRAAGVGLLEECISRYPDGCPTGEARITGGHELPARHVIHTPGPVWNGGEHSEPELLAACHRNALRLAAEHTCQSVAFPAISCGVFGYPPRLAARVALTTVATTLAEHDGIHTVRFVLFGDDMLEVFTTTLDELRQR